MRKKIMILLIILILFVSHANADSEYAVKGEASKIITAYKSLISEGVPDKAAELRLLDSNSSEFSSGEILTLPINARNNEYSAFSWVLGGNIYGQLTLGFSFGPMYLEGVSTASSIIPYKVELDHTSSRIGNTPIPVGDYSGATSSILNSFTGYYFKYADSVTVSDSSISVSSATKTASIVYAMSTYTTVTDVNNAAVSYSGGVCDHWNRYGTAIVTLAITAEGNNTSTGAAFPDGVYYADVVVTVTTQ